MVDEGERVPIRLVKENGDTISLDATSIDMVVERQQSNFAIPFFDARKMSVDLNQAALAFEVQGVFTDDDGQEETSSAVATIDLFQPQQIVSWGQPIGSSGGQGGLTGPVGSNFNGAPTGGGFGLDAGGISGLGGTNSGGLGGSFGGPVYSPNDLGNRIIDNWHKKFLELPIAYWVEAAARLDNPVKTGLQLWLKADAMFPTNEWSDKHGTPIGDTALGGGGAWKDFSGNGRDAVQTVAASKPRWLMGGMGGQPYIRFYGNDYLEIPHSPFLNSEEFTVFTVSTTHQTPDGYVISSQDATNEGYALLFNYSGAYKQKTEWGDTTSGAALQAVNAGANGANIHVMKFEDTDADAQTDSLNLRRNGHDITTRSGIDITPSGTAAFTIGRDRISSGHYLVGGVAEILVYNRALTSSEVHQVEGYLSRKYNVNLPGSHTYSGISYSYEHKHIAVGFDKTRAGSKQEPYGYLNRPRNTGILVKNVTGGVIDVDGDLREWIELSQSTGAYELIFRNPTTEEFRAYGNPGYFTTQIGQVTAVSGASVTVDYRFNALSASPQNGDEVWLAPVSLSGNLFASGQYPTLIIPIKHADTYEEFASPDKAVGPEFPNFEDGTARTSIHGADITRTDEFLAFMLEKALTSPSISVGDRPIDAEGNTTMDNLFSVSRTESSNGHQSRLIITQKYQSSLGQLSDSINTNLGVGQMPVIEGFSGGRSGKKVMSAGDKVQDILGILGNSQNFETISDVTGSVEEFIVDIAEKVQQTLYSDTGRGDYIKGIQIPYNSLITKGMSNLDTEVAQRNFFITNQGGTFSKLSDINDVHASQGFSFPSQGHYKNGISGLVTDFNVRRDAEMKAYEFSLKFVAADVIL